MNILEKLKETALSVVPVMVIVLLLGLFVGKGVGGPYWMGQFFLGGILLILGLTIFLLGVDLGIQPMGERCGAALTKKRSLTLLLVAAFIIGFIVPFAMGIWLSFCEFTTVTDAQFVGFSNYIWNTQYNLTLARKIKEKYPDCVILFGGHNVPDNFSFLEKYPYIDGYLDRIIL